MNQKEAEALSTNHDDPEKKLEELHEDPQGRAASGTLSAHWRDEGHKDPEHNGRAAWEESLKDRPGVLEKAFDVFEGSSKGDKAFIAQHFDTKDFTSHSPLLRKYAHAGHLASDATLAERVRSLTGRR